MSVVLGDFAVWTPDVKLLIIARITFIFKDRAVWLVISCHKTGFLQNHSIRLKTLREKRLFSMGFLTQ